MSDSSDFNDSGDVAAGASLPPPLARFELLGPSWQEQDGLLRDLWLQNKTPQQISATLGRSIAAIMTRAARLGLPRRAAPGRKRGRVPPDARERQGIQTSHAGEARQAAPAAAQAAQVSTRICLMCLRSFQSLGRHNRICPSCKSSSDYAAAVSMADIHFPV